MKPQRPCLYPGCPELVSSGRCDKHKVDHRECDRHRGNSTERGYGARWQRYRLQFLMRHPLCVECMSDGIVRPATVVDHIQDHKGDQELFWNQGNHQSLCKRHHDRKTIRTNTHKKIG